MTDSALAGLAFRALPSLRLSAAPGVYWIRDSTGGADTRVYVVGFEGSWRISDWLLLVGRYRRNLQRGILNSAAPGSAGTVQEIARDTIFLGLSAGRDATRAAGTGGGSAGGNR